MDGEPTGLTEYADYLRALCIERGMPHTTQFELTSRCNLSCKMCYVVNKSSDKKIEDAELTAKQWIRLAKEARDAGVLTLNVTGGEPLLKKDFWEFYDAICELGIFISLNTNATTITKEIAERLGKKPPFCVLVSIYGGSAETYGKVAGSEQGFQNARRGVELLLKEGVNVLLRTTLIKDNYKDYPIMNEWADNLGLKMMVVDYVSPRREGLETDPLSVRLESDEIIDMITIVRESLLATKEKHKNDNGSNIEKETVKLDAAKQFREHGLSEKRVKRAESDCAFTCGAAKSKFFITWDGRMTPCGLLYEPATLPLDIGIKKAWDQLREERLRIPKSEDCENCEDKDSCGYCPARLKLETGFFDRKAKYLCDYPRHY